MRRPRTRTSRGHAPRAVGGPRERRSSARRPHDDRWPSGPAPAVPSRGRAPSPHAPPRAPREALGCRARRRPPAPLAPARLGSPTHDGAAPGHELLAHPTTASAARTADALPGEAESLPDGWPSPTLDRSGGRRSTASRSRISSRRGGDRGPLAHDRDVHRHRRGRPPIREEAERAAQELRPRRGRRSPDRCRGSALRRRRARRRRATRRRSRDTPRLPSEWPMRPSPSNTRPPSQSARPGSEPVDVEPEPHGEIDTGRLHPPVRIREVRQGGDLHVLRVARDRPDLVAGPAEHRSIVGERGPGGLRLRVRLPGVWTSGTPAASAPMRSRREARRPRRPPRGRRHGVRDMARTERTVGAPLNGLQHPREEIRRRERACRVVHGDGAHGRRYRGHRAPRPRGGRRGRRASRRDRIGADAAGVPDVHPAGGPREGGGRRGPRSPTTPRCSAGPATRLQGDRRATRESVESTTLAEPRRGSCGPADGGAPGAESRHWGSGSTSTGSLRDVRSGWAVWCSRARRVSSAIRTETWCVTQSPTRCSAP